MRGNPGVVATARGRICSIPIDVSAGQYAWLKASRTVRLSGAVAARGGNQPSAIRRNPPRRPQPRFPEKIQLKIALLTTDCREHYGDYANPRPYFGAAPEALLQGLSQLPELEVHVISCVQQPVPSPEKIAENIWYHSLQVPKIGWMRTLYQGCVRATRKKLREIQPDIVHGQGTEHDCAISAVQSGFPNVLTLHGNMRSVAEFYRAWPGSFYWLAARLEGFALRRTGGVLCNSAYTENLVRPSAPKNWRVPNALRLAFLEPPREKPVKTAAAILNVGVLSPHKRQREILAMAGRLWRRGLRFELRFAGGVEAKTDYGAGFVRELAEAEKTGYARHLGNLPVNELGWWWPRPWRET